MASAATATPAAAIAPGATPASGRPRRWSTRSGAGSSKASIAPAIGAGEPIAATAARSAARSASAASRRASPRSGGRKPNASSAVWAASSRSGSRRRAWCASCSTTARSSPSPSAATAPLGDVELRPQQPGAERERPRVAHDAHRVPGELAPREHRQLAQAPVQSHLAPQRRAQAPEDERVERREQRERELVAAGRGMRPGEQHRQVEAERVERDDDGDEDRAGGEERQRELEPPYAVHPAASRWSAARRSGSSWFILRANWTRASSPNSSTSSVTSASARACRYSSRGNTAW